MLKCYHSIGIGMLKMHECPQEKDTCVTRILTARKGGELLMDMKRLFAILMTLCLCFALVACGGGAEEPTQQTEAPTEVTEAPVVEPEEPETTEAEPTGIVYTVYVKDEGGNPIASAMVQMCEGTNCMPAATNADGAATFTVAQEADFEVKFLTLPAGYEYTTEDQVFHFDAGSYELTITLKAVA